MSEGMDRACVGFGGGSVYSTFFFLFFGRGVFLVRGFGEGFMHKACSTSYYFLEVYGN